METYLLVKMASSNSSRVFFIMVNVDQVCKNSMFAYMSVTLFFSDSYKGIYVHVTILCSTANVTLFFSFLNTY